ncbi:MAG: hypothetical protein JO091_02855 [Acidobacteriaceae bacterium]|nr:hypothetical protein [Acidobacteriaceae bacterium]
MAVLPLDAQWIKLTTPHFEMYTTNTRARALDALEIFEQARAFFDENSPSETVTDFPIRIIAFKSEEEFRPYSPNAGAVAYYHRAYGRDYIVMRDLGPVSYPVAIHEYTHLYLAHRHLQVPIWLNEGLAEVYSTLKASGEQLIIGSPPPARLRAARSLPLLDLRQIFGVDEDSPYYRDPALMQQFYGDSWALAHMLFLSEPYRDNFRDFLRSLNEGKGSEQSFQEIYGKSVEQVTRDLRTYISRGATTVSSFDAQTNRRDVPELSEPTAEEAEVILADLLSSNRETAKEAQTRLAGLAASSSSNPDVQKSLGYLALEQGKLEEAREHFDQALRQGSNDPIMLLRYAGALQRSGASGSQIVSLLQRAVALKPDLLDARFALGMEAATQGQCVVSLSALAPIKTIQADRAFPLYSALTYCNSRLGRTGDARHWGELARQYAETAEQRATVEHLLQQLNRSAR